MKAIHYILLAVLMSGTISLSAEENHAHKILPGPKGGKILESTPLHAEIFVQPDRKISITFYDDGMKTVLLSVQEVKVIAEPKSGKIVLEFVKSGDVWVSKTFLPDGDGYRLVVQIKSDAAAKSQNFRVDYHAEICNECKRAEYACSCEKRGGTEGSHGH